MHRYESYSREFTYLFNKLEEYVVEHLALHPVSSCLSEENFECGNSDISEGVKICLEIFYYWVNFAPLSRGSAATGYSVLVGCIASLGEVPVSPLPHGVQIDWLGMLSSSPQEFVQEAYPYVSERVPVDYIVGTCWGKEHCMVTDGFQTARDVIYALNIEV